MDIVLEEDIIVIPSPSGIDALSKEKTVISDWKRTKWQPPPSHCNLIPKKTRNTVHKTSSRSQSHGSGTTGTGDPQRSSIIEESLDEGIEDSQFSAFASNSAATFSKPSSSHSYEDILHVLAAPKIYRHDTVARADMCPIIRRPRLVTIKGVGARIREQFGYEISNTTYLYSEEALYLLEIGKLEIYMDGVNLSIERARALLLHSTIHPKTNSSKIKSCSINDYLVYKHLSKLGYRLRRRDHDIKLGCFKAPSSPEVEPPVAIENDGDAEMVTAEGEGVMMDLDEDAGIEVHQIRLEGTPPSFSSSSSGIGKSASDCLNKRGVKRKFGDVCESPTAGSTTPTSSAKDVSDDEDADVEFDFVAAPGDVYMDSTSESHSHQQLESYTVTEADSDVDILDESMPSGVKIEEIGYDYDGDIEDDMKAKSEPQPSTSSAALALEGLVDLAESDSDLEVEVTSFCKVWNKLVPNAAIQIGFPPGVLLPPNINYRPTIYEFDLKNKCDRSDLELEYFVDELNLNSSPVQSDVEGSSKSKRAHSKSWKDWRHVALEEAKDVLNDSLLANPGKCKYPENCDNAMEKLYLWADREPEKKRKTVDGWTKFCMPFDLYSPSVGSHIHKNKLRMEYQPCYVVAVVKNDELVHSFTTCDPLIHGVPVLVAVVSDEADILFMTPDRSPVPSLF